MTIAPPTELICRQCAAPLPIEQGALLAECQFCGATNHVDKANTVFHYAVRTTVRETEAQAALRRWMAGNDTVKNLDSRARITSQQFQLFPFWLVRATQKGQEVVYLEPAAALSISELKQTAIPASDLEPFDHTFDGDAVTPTVPLTVLRTWLKEDRGVSADQVNETALVHLPIYIFKYSFDGRSYSAVVDAATSRVFANLFPSKWETPYVTIGLIAFAAYFLISFFPIVGAVVGDGSGLAVGVAAYLVAAIVVAVPIFVVAAIISARV